MSAWSKLKYRTYNPNSEGKGNTDDWKEAFAKRMGLEEKTEVKHFDKCDTKEKLTARYKKLMKKYHPDVAGNTEENIAISQEIINEYNELKKKLK